MALKDITIDHILMKGLGKNICISKERVGNYVLFLKKLIEENISADITRRQAIIIGKLLTKSIFLAELYIYGLIESNQQIIAACEGLKLNSLYEACIYNYFYSLYLPLTKIDILNDLDNKKIENTSEIINIPFDGYPSEDIIFPNNKDVLLYNNSFKKEALWLGKNFEASKFIKCQQNFALERYEYPITSFGKIKFFSVPSQDRGEIFLIAKKTDVNKGFKETIRMGKINSILLKNKNCILDFDIKIVPLFALLNVRSDCYLITEYIPGETIDDSLRIGINRHNDIKQLVKIKNILFDSGIGWKDFAPRNIIRYSSDKADTPINYLCDFERASIIKTNSINELDREYIEEHAFEEFVDLLSPKELDCLFVSLNRNITNIEKIISLEEIESNRIKTLLKRRDLLFSIGDNFYTKKKYIDTIRHELRLCARPVDNEGKKISTLFIFDLLTDKIDINYRIKLTELLIQNINTDFYECLIILIKNIAEIYLNLLLKDEYDSRVIYDSTNLATENSSAFAKFAIDLLKEKAGGNQLNQFLLNDESIYESWIYYSYNQSNKKSISTNKNLFDDIYCILRPEIKYQQNLER